MKILSLSNSNYPWRLQTDISNLLQSGDLTDMVLVSSLEANHQIRVHKAVLLPLCPVLQDVAGAEEDLTVIIDDVPLSVIQSLVHVLYHGSCLTPCPLDVLLLARRLGLHHIDPDLGLRDNLKISRDFNIQSVFPRQRERTREKNQVSTIDDPIMNLDTSLPEEEEMEGPEKLENNNNEDNDNINNDDKVKLTNTSDSGVGQVGYVGTVFTCKLCEESFKSVKHLISHTNRSHKGTLFSCYKCNYKSYSYKNFRKHINRNRKIHQNEVDFYVGDQENVVDHSDKNQDNDRSSSLNGSIPLENYNLNEGENTKHNSAPRVSPVREAPGSDSSQRTMAAPLQDDSQSQESGDQIHCQECSLYFPSEIEASRHLFSNHLAGMNEGFWQSFYSEEGGVFTCRSCEEQAFSEDEAKLHSYNKHKIDLLINIELEDLDLGEISQYIWVDI